MHKGSELSCAHNNLDQWKGILESLQLSLQIDGCDLRLESLHSLHPKCKLICEGDQFVDVQLSPQCG